MPTARASATNREHVWIVVPTGRVLYRTVHLPLPFQDATRQACQYPLRSAFDSTCMIFGSPLRPKVCSGLQPGAEMCGSTRQQAITYLLELEALTAP